MTGAFDFRDLQPGPLEIGPLRLTLAHMNHPVETFGFRFEAGDAVLAYSADTGESAAWWTWPGTPTCCSARRRSWRGRTCPRGCT